VERIEEFARVWWVEAATVVLVAGGVVEGLTTSSHDGRGPGWLLPLVVPLMGLPLLAQRRFPFAAPFATVLVADVIAVASDGHTISDSGAAFLLLLLVAWLFGRLGDRRSAVTGLVVLLASVFLVDAVADELEAGNLLFPTVLFSLVWGASFFVRSRATEAREAEERVERLAAEQQAVAAEAVAAERRRIAGELHDVVAHSVSVMTVQAGAVRRLLLPEQEREREALLAVESTGREALAEMRRLAGLLREESGAAEFAPQPSLRALDILIGTAREAGLRVDVDVQGRVRDLPPGVDLNAYRLLQDALTSVLASSSDPRARVRLDWGEQELELEVACDGRYDVSSPEATQALAGMRERVTLLGGRLEAEAGDSGGIVVRCHLPLESAA
jgi:signal transduction histidine kinase